MKGEERDQDESNLNGGAISLQKLLASNAITNENGVIYLDTSSAQSLFSSFWYLLMQVPMEMKRMKKKKAKEKMFIKDSRMKKKEEKEEKEGSRLKKFLKKIDDEV